MYKMCKALDRESNRAIRRVHLKSIIWHYQVRGKYKMYIKKNHTKTHYNMVKIKRQCVEIQMRVHHHIQFKKNLYQNTLIRTCKLAAISMYQNIILPSDTNLAPTIHIKSRWTAMNAVVRRNIFPGIHCNFIVVYIVSITKLR